MSDLGEYVLSGKEINPNVVRSIDKVEGGGNPNRVETITGTATAPFGDLDVSALSAAITNGDANCVMEIDGSVMGGGMYEVPLTVVTGGFIYISQFAINDDSTGGNGYVIFYATDGGLLTSKWYFNNNLVDAKAYADTMPTTLTIYWHPMPEA